MLDENLEALTIGKSNGAYVDVFNNKSIVETILLLPKISMDKAFKRELLLNKNVKD